MRNVERLCLAHFWVAFAAFLVAALLGTWQMWVRSPLGANVGTPGQYFMSVTAHGVSMAYVLTTFFIMGFGYFVAVTALNRPLPGKAWAWAAFWMAIVGVVMVLITDPHRPRLGALHVLSAAHGEPLLLYRTGARRGRVVGLVRSHARRDARLEARESRPARAAGDVRDSGERGDVALDHRRRCRRAAVSSHSGVVRPGADHRCGARTHAVLVDAARHRLFLAHPGLYRVLHDRAAGGRRPPLQRHDGTADLHSVPGLQPSGRNAPSDDGSPSTATAGSSSRCC